MPSKREIIATPHAPAAIGPYSQAVQIGDLIYTAGQIPLVPETGKLVEGGIEEQTQQVLQNLSRILEAGGSSLAHIIKTTIFVTDLADFAALNKVYGSFLPATRPLEVPFK